MSVQTNYLSTYAEIKKKSSRILISVLHYETSGVRIRGVKNNPFVPPIFLAWEKLNNTWLKIINQNFVSKIIKSKKSTQSIFAIIFSSFLIFEKFSTGKTIIKEIQQNWLTTKAERHLILHVLLHYTFL